MIAGIDEAGRGCLAGPVVAGAVILPETFELPGLTDSKKLTERGRLELEPAIKAQAVAWGLGVAWAPEIDRINILQATFSAMSRALALLGSRPTLVLVDGDKIIPNRMLHLHTIRQRAEVEGDARIPAISAASILAKTFRDRIMSKLENRFPGYGFGEHKGYGTQVHREAILRLGPCAQHRMTFRGVRPEPKPVLQERPCLPGI